MVDKGAREGSGTSPFLADIIYEQPVIGVLNIQGQEKCIHWTHLEVNMYSKYTAHISSNESRFLAAEFLVYCTYKVRTSWDYLTKIEVTLKSKCTACTSSNRSHFVMAWFFVY